MSQPPTPALPRLAGVAAVALLLGNLIAQPLRALADWSETDYVSAYSVAARMLGNHASCLYCLDAQVAAQRDLIGNVAVVKPNPYENAPLAAWLLQPLAGLAPTTGLTIFVALLLVAALAAMALTVRWLLPEGLGREYKLLLAVAFVATWPGADALAIAGWDPLILVCAIAAVHLAERNHEVWGGVLLAVVAVKPQLVWLVALAAVAAGSWRLLAGFAAGGAVWAASTLALLGPDHILDWPRLLLDVPYHETPQTVGLPGAIAAAGSSLGGFTAALAGGLVALVLLILARRRLAQEPAVMIGLGIALSLLVAPHVWPDDLMMAAVPLAILARRTPERALAIALGISLIFLAARVSGIAGIGHLEVVALGALALELYRPAAKAGPVAAAI